jgi:CRISPR-associated protein Cmr6
MRPLYKALARNTVLECNWGNAGLWYDKFCDRWSANPNDPKLSDWTLTADADAERNPKLEWINSLPKRQVADGIELERFCRRQSKLLATFGQSPLFFKTDWCFVTGLGREYPLENGFAWHQMLGVLYLPGSSVKGMVRAYAEYWLEGDGDNSTRIDSIFGPAVKTKAAKSVGSIIFLDAVPLQPVRLEADVMTPHYGPYYKDASGGTAPGDWRSPTPLPFLVVAADTPFQFGLLPRRSNVQSDLDIVCQWLVDALDWIGAGAKTAVGYDRMSADEESLEKHEESLAREQQKKRARGAEERKRKMSPQRCRCEDLVEQLSIPGLRSFPGKKTKVLEAAADPRKAAKKWPSQEDRREAGDTLERVYDALGWGKSEKEQQRRTAIATWRLQND